MEKKTAIIECKYQSGKKGAKFTCRHFMDYEGSGFSYVLVKEPTFICGWKSNKKSVCIKIRCIE
jgi:hypothetical protein